MGAKRIELTGYSDTEVDQLKSFGFFSEIIAWRLRLFLPLEAPAGIEALSRRAAAKRSKHSAAKINIDRTGRATMADIRSADFTTNDGVRLQYLEAGAGPTLIILPGWTQPAASFRAQLEGLSGEFHCLA